MSKDKGSMSRKRFCKKASARFGMQVREVRDIVYECQVNTGKRRQERQATEKHRTEKQEGGLQ